MADQKRIIKNTGFLYARMLISMLISLYTSRVFLEALGVENLGIYNVAAGFVGMFGFLQASMGSATSRFITYALGTKDVDKLKKTFNSSMLVHAGIALITVILAETIGLWFVENKLVIPEEAMPTARIIYQLSIIDVVLSITQAPLGATIIAHEKMGFYAYMTILAISLKLFILYILIWYPWTNILLEFGLLLFAVSIINFSINAIYCYSKFKETHLSLSFDKDIIKQMVTFSGWDLYGNLSVIGRTQGVSILLNMFIGPVANAAAGIATTIQGAVMGFSANIITAMRPQIVKSYASGNSDEMFALMRMGTKITVLLLSVLTIPLLTEMPFVLKIWLGQIPEYLISFSTWTLIFNMFACVSILLAAVIHAYGDVRRISLINGTLYLAVVPITYICYKCGYADASFPYIMNVVAIFIGIISNAWSVKLYFPQFDFRNYIVEYFKLILFVICNYLILLYISNCFEESWIRLLMICSLSVILIGGSGYFLLFSKEVRTKINQQIKNKLSLSWN